MKHSHIILISGLLVSHLSYNNIEPCREELEELIYLETLALQQIAKKIIAIGEFYKQFQSYYESEMYENVGIKLKQKGIDTSITKEHLLHYGAKISAQYNSEYPIYYTLNMPEQLRNFFKAGPYEEDIKTAINEVETSMVESCNDFSSALIGNKTFKHDLSQELFELGNFDLLKFFFIQISAEFFLLKQLIIRYQQCLQKIFKLNNELLSLKQKETI